MTDTVTKLINVFSSKAAIAVTKKDIINAFSVLDYSEVEAKPDFAETFERIHRIKLNLDRITTNYLNVKNQALQCLNLLKVKRGRYQQPPDSFFEAEVLIRKSLYPHWGGIQDEYDRRCGVLSRWFDVFVSYTNRDAFATNQSYANLILREWGREVDPASTASNYIASTIAKYLQQNNLRCFYDYNNLKCGDDIEDEIRLHSSSAIALVQLLEPQTFSEPPRAKRNWCIEEFREFSNSSLPCIDRAEAHNRYFFVLARGDEINHILPAICPDSYLEWIDKASRKLYLTLNKFRDDSEGLRRAVRVIADEILDARDKIINAMLDYW